MSMKKLPKTAVYINEKEYKDLVIRHNFFASVAGKNEKVEAIRVEGKIGYNDLQKLLSSQREEIVREIQDYIRVQKKSMGKPKVLDIQREAQIQVLEDVVIPYEQRKKTTEISRTIKPRAEQMKIYTFEDMSYCYIALCVADSMEEAIKIFQESTTLGDAEIKEHEIKNGLFFEGGGNG